MLLSFNTTTEVLSVALFDIKNRTIIASFQETSPKGHARYLIPSIQALLKDSDVTFNEISTIAVCCGPGSFTGARIGCATALGLSIAKNIRAVGISAFQMQAAWAFSQISPQDSLVVLLKSGLDEWCVQELKSDFMPHEGQFQTPICLNFEDLLNRLRIGSYTLAGDGVTSFLEQGKPFKDLSLKIQDFSEDMPLWAEWIGKVTLQLMTSDIFSEVVPLYVRPSYVKMP